MSSRVLKTGDNVITFSYAEHCKKVDASKGWARGVDVVKAPMNLDYIVAHSSGTIIKCVDYIKDHEYDKEGNGYGNYVMILHDNNYATLYAHMVNVSKLTVGNKIAKGTVLGYMGNTGTSFGGHLHFEVRVYKQTPNSSNLNDKNIFEWINPEEYLDKDLPTIIENRYKIINKDGKQIGAYTNLDYAIAFASNQGAFVIDSVTGEQVYPSQPIPTPTPTPPSPQPTPTPIIAGQKVELNNTNCYTSESTPNPYGKKSGTFYLWDNVVKNNRIRITNSISKLVLVVK